MAFSIITGNPTWGTLVTNSPLVRSVSQPPVLPSFIKTDPDEADLGAVVNLGAINTSGITKPTAGWITYSSGGGSARPTSGFLYPRGNC